jgi:hypothetical protein
MKFIVMRVEACPDILQAFPAGKPGESKTEKPIVTGKFFWEILLDTQDSFPYLQPTEKRLLIDSIIAFGVSKYDEPGSMFRGPNNPIYSFQI